MPIPSPPINLPLFSRRLKPPLCNDLVILTDGPFHPTLNSASRAFLILDKECNTFYTASGKNRRWTKHPIHSTAILETLNAAVPFEYNKPLLLTDCRSIVAALREDAASILQEKKSVTRWPVIVTLASRPVIDLAHRFCVFTT